MIELINRDYADFVNLSGNLVGLDIAISNLQQPLTSIHAEILVSAQQNTVLKGKRPHIFFYL